MRIVVENLKSLLVTDDIKLKSLLVRKYSVRQKGYQFTPAYRNRGWDGYIKFFQESGAFGTGLLEDIIADLQKVGADFKIEDRRNKDEIPIHPFKGKVDLRDYQISITQKAINKERCIVKAPTACHAKGQKIIMYDGTLKNVEDIRVGDTLMGPDSTPRYVKTLYSGQDDLYQVIPKQGSKPFTVNAGHILSLKRTNDGTNKAETVENISVFEYLQKSKTYKHIHKLYRSEAIDFNVLQTLPLDPYFIGIMLGDGSTKMYPILHNMDSEIVNYFTSYCESFEGISVKTYTAPNKNCPSYRATKIERSNNPNIIMEILRDLGMCEKCENKYIPYRYKISSIEERLQLLAGLIDTDGSLQKNSRCFDFVNKSKQLVEDVSFVARSLGFRVSAIKEKTAPKICDTTYYRICISGDTHLIPCKLPRKQAKDINCRKSSKVTGFEIVPQGKGEYYGFEITGDHLYLLDDFTVTHNSGKTYVMAALTAALSDNFGVIVFNKKSLVTQTYEKFQELGIDCGICFGEGEVWRPIMLTTIQSIDKLYDQYAELAKFVMFDEVHEMCSGKFSKKVINAFPNAYYRWGFTATPPKDPEKLSNLKSAFGPVIQELTAKEMADEGKLAKPIIYMISADQSDETEDGEKILEYDDYLEEYQKFIIDCDSRNTKIADLANTLVKNKRKVLIVVKSLEHAAKLEKLIPGAVKLEGKDEMAIRNREIEIFRKAKEGVCVIGTVIFQTGVDVPEITDVINARGLKSEIATLQLLGRGMRLAEGKTEFHYYDFYDNGKYLSKHSNERAKAYIREGHRMEKLK